jgi:signal transduction histidine kinase
MSLLRQKRPTAQIVPNARLGLVLWLMVPVAGVLATLGQWPMWPRDPVLSTVNVLAPVTFIVMAFVLGQELDQRVTAWAFGLAAMFWAVGRLDVWTLGPLPFLATVCGPLATAFGAWALLRYPRPRLHSRYQRLCVLALFAWMAGGQVILTLVSTPAWHDFPRAAWWPTLLQNHAFFVSATKLYNAGGVILALTFTVLLLLRLIEARGVDRHVVAPMAVAAGAAAFVAGAVMVTRFMSLSPMAVDRILTAEGLVILAIPVAFLVAVVRRRLARAAVADLVLRVTQPATIEAVRDALREALRDPALDVLYWLPDADTYVDAAGRPIDSPTDSRYRLVVPVRTGDGEPLATVLVDPGLERHQELLHAAMAASGLALENARLQASIRAQLEQVRASRTRIVEAGLAERRRVERDLHDGAQQRLLALAATLGVARAKAVDAASAAAIDEARTELRLALQELRDLAQGIHPALLSQAGLSAAIEVVAERLPLPVEVDVPSCRFDPAAETTAYFVACEALANTVKHARASRATVRVRSYDRTLRLEVVDDGKGGADPAGGSGLAGLADRVRALGGDLIVASPQEVGTHITARIPCG